MHPDGADAALEFLEVGLVGRFGQELGVIAAAQTIEGLLGAASGRPSGMIGSPVTGS
jgi:hypothetical protein